VFNAQSILRLKPYGNPPWGFCYCNIERQVMPMPIGNVKRSVVSTTKKVRLQVFLSWSKQWLVVYPLVFLLCLFGVGMIDQRSAAYVDLPAQTAPLGQPDLSVTTADPTMSPADTSATLDLDGVPLTLIYEKDTNRYLVYSHFACIGYVNCGDVGSIHDITSDNLRGLMHALGS